MLMELLRLRERGLDILIEFGLSIVPLGFVKVMFSVFCELFRFRKKNAIGPGFYIPFRDLSFTLQAIKALIGRVDFVFFSAFQIVGMVGQVFDQRIETQGSCTVYL